MNNLRRISIVSITLVLLVLSLGEGCITETGAPAQTSVPTAGPASTAISKPTTLRIGHTSILDTLNPGNAWENWAARYLWYDTLVEWGGYDHFKPGLAESWSVSSDGLVWTFKIRPGVTFHDGTPCTAKEIAWNIIWQKENQLGTTISYLRDMEQAVALDATTLQITVSEPVGNMITQKLPLVWILPPSIWKDIPSDKISEFVEPAAAIGTGPYKLVEYVEDEYMILEANKDYWQGSPSIDRIIWRQYATEDSLVLALQAGEIDVMHIVPPLAVDPLRKDGNTEVAIMPTNRLDVLVINSHENGTQPKSLKDPVVRLAMAHAVNKQKVIDVAYLYAQLGTVIVPPSMGDFYNSSITDIAFDPDLGNRLLEQGGYIDRNNDGIREDADGNPMKYRFYTYVGSTWARIAEMISQDLAEIGISIAITAMDENTLAAQVYPKFDYDLIYWYWGLDISDPNSALRLLLCEERAPGGWNDTGYCNEDYEKLYRQQATSLDHQKRREFVWAMQEMVFKDLPYIVVCYPQFIQAYRKDRFTFSQDCGNLLWKECLLKAEAVR